MSTALGVGMMLASTTTMNVGMVLQKKAVDALPPLEGRPVLESARGMLGAPVWVLGWALTSGAIVLNWVALGQADMSIIQPLNGFGLVVLALFSRAYLGERLTPHTLQGMGAVLVGLVALGVGASEGRAFATTDELYRAYGQPSGLGTLAGMALAIGALWVAARRAQRWSGVLYAVGAALSSVLGLTCAKGLFASIDLLGLRATFGGWESYALGTTMLICSTLALVLQQLSFQKGRAVVVTPVCGAVSVAFPLLPGALVFGEAIPLSALAAVGCIGLGVAILGRSGAEAAPGEGPAAEPAPASAPASGA